MADRIHKIPLNGSFLFVNAGTVVPDGSTRRRWIACREYGFISAGQTKLDVEYISKLQSGDLIAAYENRKGFLAIGRVSCEAVPILPPPWVFLPNSSPNHHDAPPPSGFLTDGQ